MECNICFEQFNDILNKPYSFYPCGHTYCINCINRLPEPICPMCNQMIKDILPNYAILQLIADPIARTKFNESSVKAELNNTNLVDFDDNIQQKIYKRKLSQIFQASLRPEEIIYLIESEFNEFDLNSNVFIRVLVTTLVRSCLSPNNKLTKKQCRIQLMNFFPIFIKYITLNEEFELETLLAIQALDQKLRHPGFISGLLTILFNSKIISLETFLKWKNNNCKNITKDADKQLKKFFEIVLPSSTAFFNGRAQQERNIPHLIFKSQYQTNFGENLKPTVTASTVVYQKRERKPLLIVDPLTKQIVFPQAARNKF